ncbi:hypothetical protein TNCV_2986961 [Trichonephila clavipes]|nr:hypothetical protein TNCV_2986961 [Trichonephila clavipes]
MRDQKVCAVRRITIRKDGQVLNTKHLILTFSTPDLPQFVKWRISVVQLENTFRIRLRCFNCQRYGQSFKERLSGPANLPSLRRSGSRQ